MHTYPGVTSPMDWLTRIPIPVVQAHISMLPVLEAEASLIAANRIGVGTGSLAAETAAGMMRDWAAIAKGEDPAQIKPKANPAAFGRTGLQVKRVKRRRPA